MSAVIGIVLLIYIMNKAWETRPMFEEEYEQPPISEFGEIDDKNWGKKLF